MKKYLIYLLFIFILLLVPKTYCNVISPNYYNITATNGGTRNRYVGFSAIDDIGADSTYVLGTRYNGKLSAIKFYLHYAASGGYRITLTLNMATEDWRNNFYNAQVVPVGGGVQPSVSVSNITYVSMKKIYFSFTPSSDYTDFLITVQSPSLGSAFTGVSNWNLSSIVLDDHFYDSSGGGSSGGSSTPTPTPGATTQDIINNQNQNTQDIINNQDNNTQDIINNQDNNTQDIIENNNSNTQSIIDNNNANLTCPEGPLEFTRDEWAEIQGKYLKNDGSEGSSSSYGISPYFIIKPNTEYKLLLNNTSSAAHYCLYNSSKGLISCSPLSSTTISFTTSNSVQYLRITLGGGRVLSLKGPVCNDWEKEAMDKLKDVNQGIYDSINDDNIDDKTGFFTGFNNNTHGLTGIISLPLSTIQSLANSSCVNLSLPVPFTNDIFDLPCMTQVYQSAIPDIFSMWQVVSFGIVSYYICIDIFKMVKGFKDPNEDKIEVLDL